jgi:hypothetical protein
MFGRLRITAEGELEGLDLHEHGAPAYPEYVISALAAPRGYTKDLIGNYPDKSDAEMVGSNR